MVVLVVILNCLISLFGFYVAWQIWNLRRVLADVAQVVSLSERDTQAVLEGAPEAILQGQIGVSEVRSRYGQLEPQVQRLQQVLAILTLLLKVGQQLSPRWQRLKLRRRRRRVKG